MSGARRSSGRGARGAISDAEFRRLVEEAKEKHNITDVARCDRKVIGRGKEAKALCAFHNERSPSMQLNDAKGTFHCFGCGVGGDIVTYVMHVQRCDFRGAMRWLGSADLPEVDPAQRARAAVEDEAERAAAIAEAQAIWDRAAPAAGTPAEVYLRSRGILIPPPSSIRFVSTYAWRDAGTGETGPDLPALIAAVTWANDQITGLQRIFLRDGGRAKASMSKPKRSLGRIKGGAVRVGDPSSDEILITEGPEDALTLAQAFPGKEIYAALGTAMMPFVDFPADVRAIVIAGQNDGAGREAVDAAGLALTERGHVVRTMYPHEDFKDWNDQLRGIRK
jgi:DNA primase